MSVLDCVIVGGGQSGLYAGRCLQQAGARYVILEAGRVGDVWRNRLAGMKLFTSRQFCALPGLNLEGDPGGFPGVAEIADYLRSYTHRFQLNIKEETKVVRVERPADHFQVVLHTGELIEARSIVNATGSNQRAIVPPMASHLAPSVLQIAADEQNLGAIKDGASVVVVGAGASGRQIAAELARRCTVTLARGKKRALPPNRILGRDIFWWLNGLGVLFADKRSLVARVLQRRNPVPCGELNDRHLKRLGVKLAGRAVGCEANSISFSDGTRASADAVVWAMGYRDETAWLTLPGAVHQGEFVSVYGATPVPGLYTVGRKWLSCRASELLMGVERDVKVVTEKLLAYLEGQT